MSCCSFCDRNLNKDIGGDDFLLLPCGCVSCPRCIILRTINRSTTSQVKCMNTEHQETSIHKMNYFYSNRTKYTRSNKIDVKNTEISIEKDPVKHFLREFDSNESNMKSTMCLNLVYARKSKSDGKLAVHSVISVLDATHGFESQKDKNNLRTIFGLLHNPIMAQHKIDSIPQASYPRMTPAEFCEYCYEKDNSLLLKLIYALATGTLQFEPPPKVLQTPCPRSQKTKTRLSNFLAVCVAKGMIERINSHTPGPFQLMIADTLSLVNAPNSIKNFLSKIRVTIGTTTTDRYNIRNEITNLRRRIHMKPTEAFVIGFDNFSFSGHKGQHAMHTIIQIMVISEKRLKELGFYNPVLEERISRVRKTFGESMELHDNNEHALADSIVCPNTDDYEILTNRIFRTIRTVARFNLPSIEECRELIDTAYDLKWPDRFPSNLGVKVRTAKRCTTNSNNKSRSNQQHLSCSLDLLYPDDKEGATNDVSKEQEENKKINESDGNESKIKNDRSKKWRDAPCTFFEKNNIILDEVLHGDPGSDMVMRKFVQYIDKASEVDATELDDERLCGEEPVRHIIAPATADGGPARRWLDFQALDIQRAEGIFEDRQYKKPRVFFAGLHYMMEFLSMRGRLCRDLTSFFASKWRTTEKGLEWIYLIRDPTDALEEWREYLVAHYAAAAESAGSKDPRRIHLYMLKRSIEKPMCQGILFDLRLLEIVFMIRDSEKAGTHGDVPLFLTCLRFSLPLFAITHATNYCYLVCEFLEWYKLASDAEKILFENFFYTKLSVGGKPIWADRGVEWTVGYIRKFMGHRIKSTKNHDRMVDRTVADLPLRMRAKKDLRYILNYNNHDSYSTVDWNEQEFQIGQPLLATRIALSDTNFWGPGEFMDELETVNEDCIVIPGIGGSRKEYEMSSSILGGYHELGIPRIREYYVKHHYQNRYQKTRSEKSAFGVCLKVLPTTHARRAKDIATTKLIRYLCDISAIEKLKKDFPMPEIIQEVDYYRQYIPGMPNDNFVQNLKRRGLVECLCKYRRIYFDTFPDEERSTIESVEELDRSESVTTEVSRRNQIEASPLYYLDASILSDLNDG